MLGCRLCELYDFSVGVLLHPQFVFVDMINQILRLLGAKILVYIAILYLLVVVGECQSTGWLLVMAGVKQSSSIETHLFHLLNHLLCRAASSISTTPTTTPFWGRNVLGFARWAG